MVISVGVAAFIKSNYPILPFDTFVKEICLKKDIEIARFKTRFDFVCLGVSLISSIIFFGRIKGINIGTLVSATILGSMIGACLNLMNKYVEGKTIFSGEKINAVLDFDFLNFLKVKV